MHLNLAHAAIGATLIFLTVWGFKRAGLTKVGKEHTQWDWKLFFAIFVVLFIFNLVWPQTWS